MIVNTDKGLLFRRPLSVLKGRRKNMNIFIDKERQLFHLKAGTMSYIFQIVKDSYPLHLYWGRAVKDIKPETIVKYVSIAFSPNPLLDDRSFSLDTICNEYPAYGNSDFRGPAYQVQGENGTTASDLRYAGYRIINGKTRLQGLPSTYILKEEEANTLEIDLIDSITGLVATLSYTAYVDFNVITRSVRFQNDGQTNLRLLRALSMCVDFYDSNFELLNLHGAWARERHIEKRPLTSGTHAIESRRGASSPQQNPFIALLGKGADEENGEVYGFSLVYSGNFIAQVEVDQYRTSRVTMGINYFDFSWLLEPGENFQTPEVVMVYSSSGLGDLSRTYHKLYRTRLCRGEFKERIRPILINNWEATYFNFNAKKIMNIAQIASDLGIELFVLDDGWFGKRDNDKSSLGDWVVDKKKLPEGLKDLAERINNTGMKFGLWFEPEMISPDSNLYRTHPDWCIHVPDRGRSESRNQLVLDLSREDVCNYIILAVSDILKSAPISYVKWDMNRHMSEIGSALLPPERQRETAHRYMLGLYKVMDSITDSFPHILFESCSGGGGRFDPGILYYMPQTWTSDNTDAIERLKIQYGTSLVYPASTMGAHVSAVPNHQVGRVTSLKTRGDVAMSGNLGYELDVTKFTEDEKVQVRDQVAQYKGIRNIIQFGDMYRLLSPFEGNNAAWMFVSENKAEAFIMFTRVQDTPNSLPIRLKLKGLDPMSKYEIMGYNLLIGGDELMYIGINIPWMHGDYQSVTWTLKKNR